jgi:hypothetical protein
LPRCWKKEGEPLMMAESEDALQRAVLSGEISAGIALPEDIFEQLTAGGRPW